jgi:hypothetical protein
LDPPQPCYGKQHNGIVHTFDVLDGNLWVRGHDLFDKLLHKRELMYMGKGLVRGNHESFYTGAALGEFANPLANPGGGGGEGGGEAMIEDSSA